MLNNIPLLVGLRYVRAKRRNAFISFVSVFALVGMALGVFALITVLSVMNGFDRELKERILRAVPHGAVTAPGGIGAAAKVADQLAAQPEVLGAAPYVEAFGLAGFGGSNHSVVLQGVDPSRESNVSEISQFMLSGSLTDLTPGDYGIVLGSLLARYLEVLPGDRVDVTLPQVSITPAGVFPRTRRFTVVGIFEVGAQLDQNLAIVHIVDAQRLLRRGGRADGVRVRFADLYSALGQVDELAARLGPEYRGRDWSETQGSLFQAVQMEKTVVGVMLTIVILVAAFNIVTSLVMMIAEKRSDIAVLRTMGLKASQVVAIFLVQGLALGLAGITLGAITGLITAYNLAELVAFIEGLMGVQIFDPDVYFVTALPSEVRLQDVVWVCCGAFIIALLATLYPAYRASRVRPAEALSYAI